MSKHKLGIVIFGISATIAAAHGASLLKPATFPKTFQDIPLADRMAVKAEGYEPYEPDFDENGNCISGCAYTGITIEDELAAMERNTRLAAQHLQSLGLIQGGTGTHPTTTETPGITTTPPPKIAPPELINPTAPTTAPAAPSTPAKPTTPTQTQPAPAPTPAAPTQPPAPTHQACSPNQPDINPSNRVPLGEPLRNKPRITSPYGDRIHPIKKRRIPHWGIDFGVPVGTDVFSPAVGTVQKVWTDKSCGRGIIISHSDGYQTVYCHLNEQLVKVGDTVGAGCLIARSGNTGGSTGPHLHYAIKRDGNYINPAITMQR